MTSREQSRIQEDLVALYLRLNGYFVSGLILHSAVHGKNRAEIDAIAIRLPFSCEPDRTVVSDPKLQTSDSRIDLLLCEVKSHGQNVRFNEPLTRDITVLESALRWAGIAPAPAVPGIAAELSIHLKARSTEQPATVLVSTTAQIRAIIFVPETENRRNNQPWCIDGNTMFNYIEKCLAPVEPRDTCSVQYDLTSWGRFEYLVKYFKKRHGPGPGTIKEIYSYVAEDAR